MLFDDQELEFADERFQRCDLSEYYPSASEAIPPNAPEVREIGHNVVFCGCWSCWVPSDKVVADWRFDLC